MTSHLPHMVLHIGAPKCGSSALQTTLSMTPDLRGADGTKYRYTSAQNLAGSWRIQTGRIVTQSARLSPYGYVSWPNLSPKQDNALILNTVHKSMQKGLNKGFVPILSAEGWIYHHAAFASAFAEWGHPPVDVVVFLRPVVDWTNAAFWQWGVWNARGLDRWMARSNMPYGFADDIAAWAQIPNVRLTVRSMRPEVVSKFADTYAITLDNARQSNTASSPALIGFLLRNRKFRLNGHDAATEFIVQRWCPPVAGRKLWAIAPRHVHKLRPVVNHTIAVLRKTLPAKNMEELLTDPRWTSEKPYHDDILAGATKLDDPEACGPFYEALCEGARNACQAAGWSAPECPNMSGNVVTLQDWDDAISPVLETLLAADARARQLTVPQWQRSLFHYFKKLGKI